MTKALRPVVKKLELTLEALLSRSRVYLNVAPETSAELSRAAKSELSFV